MALARSFVNPDSQLHFANSPNKEKLKNWQSSCTPYVFTKIEIGAGCGGILNLERLWEVPCGDSSTGPTLWSRLFFKRGENHVSA